MPTWTHRVILDGADITARTISGATVDEGENVSHVCDVQWRPQSGVQDPDGLIGKTIKVDIDIGGGWQGIFTGAVIRATWEQRARVYTIRASNRLQEHFRAMGTAAAVLAALPGSVYSNALFGEQPDDLWEYAQRCMETLEQDVHLDRTGAQVQISWAAKGVPDHALVGAPVRNGGAFNLIRPDLDETINQVVIEYQYRVQRHKTRAHTINWSAWTNTTNIQSWCSWAIGAQSREQFNLPLISMVRGAMMGGSWSVPSDVRYVTHPKSASNLCGVNSWVWVNPEGGDQQVTSASATGYRSFGQPITETYTLTVRSVAAQGVYGTTVTDAKSGSLAVETNPDWPPDVAQTPDAGWAVDTIGDAYQDQDDESARVNDLQCGYQWAARRIRGAMRATSLTIRTDIDPAISLADTIEVQAYGLRAIGKARGLRYVLDSATPYLDLTLAISRGGGGTTTPWSVPARPDTTDPGYPAPPAATALSTYVGNTPNAPVVPVPDERLGWITNVGSYICSPPGDPCPDQDQIYDTVFRVEWPEIEDAAAQEREESAPSSWDLAVDNDVLELT